jgi:two-component system, OmpR family, KDP operon response regulator KdpE
MLGHVVLLVAEEPQLRRLLRVTFNHNGVKLVECRRPCAMAELLESQRPNLVLLDTRVSSDEPVNPSQLIRDCADVPVIAITDSQRDEEVALLDAGADDCLKVPFGSAEILARARAVLRRSLRFRSEAPPKAFRVGALEVNFTAREVRLRGKTIHLTPTEYKLLGVLVASAGKVVTHERLLREVWGPASIDQVQYLRVYMRQLRRKLEQSPTSPEYLVTEPAVGYRLRLPA